MVIVVNEKIFIAIPAFQEEDLLNTVKSIYDNAEKPDNIYIGICNQRLDNNFEDFSEYPNVRTANLTTPFPFGLGMGYLLSSWLLQKEYYVMRIDGHMRFKKNWDRTLKYYHNLISKRICYGVVISSRPLFFEKDGDGNETYHDLMQNDPFALKRELIENIHSKNNSIVYKEEFTENFWEDKEYIETHFVSGAFQFSTIDYFKDIIPDPRIFMFGEEHTIPLRAWTHGYKMYCIKEPVLFHLNKTSDYRDNLGSDDWINNVPKTDNASLLYHYQLYYADILLGKEFGPFAAKDQESYDAYTQAMGYPYVDLIDQSQISYI
jgi:hypothetical protein